VCWYHEWCLGIDRDIGVSWSQNLISGIVTGLATKGNEVFSVGTLPVYHSTDNGINWTQLDDDGLPGTIWNTMQFTTDYALVNFYGIGVYRRQISEVTDIHNEKSNNSLSSFMLNQNYPNPFNPTTSLSFVIGHRSIISLKVYDILGNEVASLLNEEKPADEYEISFNGNGLPSGVYFYQLIAENYIQSRKMLLLK
jgi:hypothetical protein